MGKYQVYGNLKILNLVFPFEQITFAYECGVFSSAIMTIPRLYFLPI